MEQEGIDDGKCRQPKTQIIENNQKNPHILVLSTFWPQCTQKIQWWQVTNLRL